MPIRDRQYQRVLPDTLQGGFTLIELMVVVVILSIFAGMMTLSVGGTESRKNRAFYEHLIDSLSYVRLVSAERMQPMGLALQADNQGQVQPVIVQLTNPYAAFEAAAHEPSSRSVNSHNSMQLSAMSRDNEHPMPRWVVADTLTLPKLPPNVSIEISALEVSAAQSTNQTDTLFSASPLTTPSSSKQLQPWFVGTDVPQVLWFGTGEAAPARIEVRYNKRLVGDAIVLLPDGRIKVGE